MYSHTAIYALYFMVLTGAAASGQPTELNFVSQIDYLEIDYLARLPANLSAVSSDVSCPASIESPETAGGREIAKDKWFLTGEVTISGLTFVSFVGNGTPGTSGSCSLSNGNVGIFEGSTLRGLVYAPKGAKAEIGTISALEGDGLRIWDGGYLSQPLADLQVIDGNLVIMHNVASRDSFCEGAVTVPNIYRLPINIARRLLLAEGWLPAAETEEAPAPYIEELRLSLPELRDCSGAGFNFCGWDYVKVPGRSLTVVTTGEAVDGSWPVVTKYDVSCHNNK